MRWFKWLWKALTCTIFWPIGTIGLYKIGAGLGHRGGTWGAPIVGCFGAFTAAFILTYAAMPGYGFSSTEFIAGVAAYAVKYICVAFLVFTVLTDP